MSTFERYLTVWVALCIILGIALGQFFPSVFHVIGSAEIAKVNLPVAVLIWLMIIPMLVKIDFAALSQVKDHWRGIGVTLFINWAVKPFSMALLGLAIRRLVVQALPSGGSDQQLYRRSHSSRGSAVHCNGVRLEQPLRRRTAFHAEPSCAQRRHYGVRVCADCRAPSRLVGNYCPVGNPTPVGRPLYCCAGNHCPDRSPNRVGERR